MFNRYLTIKSKNLVIRERGKSTIDGRVRQRKRQRRSSIEFKKNRKIKNQRYSHWYANYVLKHLRYDVLRDGITIQQLRYRRGCSKLTRVNFSLMRSWSFFFSFHQKKKKKKNCTYILAIRRKKGKRKKRSVKSDKSSLYNDRRIAARAKCKAVISLQGVRSVKFRKGIV